MHGLDFQTYYNFHEKISHHCMFPKLVPVHNLKLQGLLFYRLSFAASGWSMQSSFASLLFRRQKLFKVLLRRMSWK